ncbi:MAG: hypothetical protein KGZ54_03850 [Dethiobacter sp.]|jgi:hypothetical protein|nr:hypothetical protein [Dethiobacter sp.]MBS3901138.1 hypothetical protein [Dethiobacter sp.]
MQDSIARSAVAGVIGAVIMNVSMYLIMLIGVETVHPIQVAADIFVDFQLVNTTIGLIIGLVGTIALSIASALAIVLIFKWTGYDYSILKGIIVVNAIGFSTMGLFMPLLQITPIIQTQPLTNLLALLHLTLIGAVMAVILNNYRVVGTKR